MKLQPSRKAITVDTEALIDNLSGPEMVELVREIALRLPFREHLERAREIINDPQLDP